MRWIIQEDLFEENYTDSIEEAFGDLGMAHGNGYDIIKYMPFSDATYLPAQPDNDVVVYGSINLLKQVQRHTKWEPGAGVTWDNYRCSVYYPHFKDLMLNSNSDWVALGDLPYIMNALNRPMFIRPDDGDKLWIGGIYDPYEAARHVDFLLTNGTDPETTMLVATPQDIKKEGRFFVIGNKLITGSLYMENSRRSVRELGSFSDLGFFVECVLAHTTWRPDPVFAVDVCSIDDAYQILEISAFHCAGLYGCDIKKLFTKVHKYYSGEKNGN